MGNDSEDGGNSDEEYRPDPSASMQITEPSQVVPAKRKRGEGGLIGAAEVLPNGCKPSANQVMMKQNLWTIQVDHKQAAINQKSLDENCMANMYKRMPQ